jgi:hypothetical protein
MGQHREWFIASLLPHLRDCFITTKDGTQVEALEIAMRLHETPIQDATLGVQQIHCGVAEPLLRIAELEERKEARPEVREEVWCLKCKSQGHDKDHCPVFVNYIAGGGPMPLRQEAPAGPSMGPCAMVCYCQVAGKHVTDNCHLLQNLYRHHNNSSATSANRWAMMSVTVIAMN